MKQSGRVVALVGACLAMGIAAASAHAQSPGMSKTPSAELRGIITARVPVPIARPSAIDAEAAAMRSRTEVAKTARALNAFAGEVDRLTQSTLVLLDGAPRARRGSRVALNEVSVPEPATEVQKSEAYVPQVSSKIISESAYANSHAPAKTRKGGKSGRDAMANKLKKAIEDALAQRGPSEAKQQPGEGSLEWTSQPQSGNQGATVKATGSLNVKIQSKH